MRSIAVGTAAALLLALAPSPARAHVGFGMAVDREGRVVFLDSLRSRVCRIERDGSFTVLAEGKHGNGLVRDREGNLYVQHVNQSLWRIAPDRSASEVAMPARNAAPGRVGSLDECVAIDDEGNLYASAGNDFYQRSPQLLRIAPSGEVTLVAGGEPGFADGRGGEARFGHIGSAAWGPDGALYVADAGRVRRVTREGGVTTLAGSEQTGLGPGPSALEEGRWRRGEPSAVFGRLFGIAVDEGGTVYVADADNFRVCRIASDGSVSTVHGTGGRWKPVGVAVAPDGLYVMERMFIPLPATLEEWFETHRIVRVGPDGSAKTLASLGGGAGYVIAGALALVALLIARNVRQRRRRASPAPFRAQPT
jgi:sugar lactone lactonase YvrE